jgi:predicted O-linked N-acetylglucosamine transferase (SPINDLY family)
MESSNEFIDCSELADREIVSLARSKALDIAIDLKGHTADNRLRIFSARIAPIQASFLGFPGTTGLSSIDYFIADKVTVPDGGDEEFSEKVIKLPVCYQPGSTKVKFSLESRKKIRSQLGISDCQFLYCNFNTSYKISPSDICLWSEILKKVDGSLFWYMPVTDRAHKGIVGEFLKNGVDPQRILRAAKVPWENHMERLSAADCFLDTEVISAHTTARDALTAGLPVVTHAGNSFAGRVGSSVGRSFGLFQSSGLSRERYVEVACDTMKLHALSEFLRSQENHSLGDGSDFSRFFYSAMKELSSRSSFNHDGKIHHEV